MWLGSAVCARGHRFAYLDLGDMMYGYLLARAPGRAAYVRAIEDPVWGEVFALVDELAPALDTDARMTAGQRAFAEVACDPDPDGRPWSLGRIPCARCGADAVRWGRGDELVDAPPDVTHERWLASDAATRRALVQRSLGG